jgi:DNA-directed RNA polymerase subunit RPC12/RpoP
VKFTRNRGSKRLRFRAGNGRFARTPDVETLFGMANCTACGRFFEAFKLTDEQFPEKVRVTHCPHCGTQRLERTL